MALIKCRDCGNDVSTEADFCPKCGAKPAKEVKQAVPSDQVSAGTAITIIAVVAVVALIAGLWISLANKPPPTAAELEGLKPFAAFGLCKKGILARLRDPDSAEFKTTYSSEVVKRTNDDGYAIEMVVRATNGFGGRGLTVFDCKVVPSGPESLMIQSLEERTP